MFNPNKHDPYYKYREHLAKVLPLLEPEDQATVREAITDCTDEKLKPIVKQLQGSDEHRTLKSARPISTRREYERPNGDWYLFIKIIKHPTYQQVEEFQISYYKAKQMCKAGQITQEEFNDIKRYEDKKLFY